MSEREHAAELQRMATTPGAGRDRPASSTAPPGNNAKKKKAGAALDPTHHQRGCHPARRSDSSAPRQGIKTASASRHCQCCRFSDLLSMTTSLRSGAGASSIRPGSIVRHRIGNRKQSRHGLSKNSLQLIADVTEDPFTLFGCNRVVLVKNDKDATRGRPHARNATLSHALSVRSVCGNQSCGGASARYRGRRG